MKNCKVPALQSSHCCRHCSLRSAPQMTQQPPVQETDDGQREHVGKGKEAAVEDATNAVSGVRVDIHVDAGGARLASKAVVDNVVLREQWPVGE